MNSKAWKEAGTMHNSSDLHNLSTGPSKEDKPLHACFGEITLATVVESRPREKAKLKAGGLLQCLDEEGKGSEQRPWPQERRDFEEMESTI